MGNIQKYVRYVRVPHILIDFVLFCLSFGLSFLLRRGWEGAAPLGFGFVLKSALVFSLARSALFVLFRVYEMIWRYVSFGDIVKITRALAASILFNFILSRFIASEITSYLFVIDGLVAGVFVLSARLLRRWTYEQSSAPRAANHARATLIYGADNEGRLLAQFFANNPQYGFVPMGFVAEGPEKVGRTINGLRVLGELGELSPLTHSVRAQEVMIATKNTTAATLQQIVKALLPHDIKPYIVSDWSQMTPSSKKVAPVRRVELGDLLSRERRTPDLTSVRQLMHGSCVLITGAGGTIGSELARQIVRMKPSRVLILDHSEASLYHIDGEIRSASLGSSPTVVPILLDIKDKLLLKKTFEIYRPDVVFHAAAYKHVHLVECNASSSLLNNVVGTYNVVECAKEFGVHTFVLISTDKAVNPVGVMGATKRVCELIVTHAGVTTGRNYCSVRFGNVLGSSGSLIPLLMKQIENGSPVTITHPDMTRYFMLIPEAVSLVLRATTLANAGDIAVLRMGEALKIVDIARNLIALMGRTEEEIPLQFTGIRPGEKLFEEMYIVGNEIETADPDVLIVPKGEFASLRGEMKEFVESLARRALLGQEITAGELLNAVHRVSGVPAEANAVTFTEQARALD